MILERYGTYSREDLHNIYSSNKEFVRGSGKWGLVGIVELPQKKGDFIFLVTFGHKEGEHQFEEGITKDGVLTWQSQPQQKLTDPQIRKFINHDEEENSIHLMLRTEPDRDYTYLGLLKYLRHDAQREKPVYFQWHILDWKVRQDVFEDMGLILEDYQDIEVIVEETVVNQITDFEKVCKPEDIIEEDIIESTKEFKARKSPDYTDREKRNRKLGLKGEELVLESERRKLIDAGKKELADKVEHTSQLLGDGAGYDIKSYDGNSNEIYIEVKTTRGGKGTGFYISPNEVMFSNKNSESYYLYRIYNYSNETNTGKCLIFQGSIEEYVRLKPTEYKASLL